MDENRQARFVRLLATLAEHEVEIIVVGGIAALLEGAPIVTFDRDVLYEDSPANVARLLAALRSLGARYRDPAGRQIVPDADKLRRFRRNLMLTDLGPLDALREIGNSLTYADLIDRTNEHEVAGLVVRALNLGAIIETKAYADRPKDRAALEILRELEQLRLGS